MRELDLAIRQPLVLRADASRVIAKLFVPGHPEEDSGGQVVGAVSHILALADHEVEAGLADILDRFGGRHRELESSFDRHAARVSDRIPADLELSVERRRLLGAAFTHEYSIEAAALCNPSLVVAPTHTESSAGTADLVLSTRGIGEAHRSSIGFRRARVDEHGAVSVEDAGAYAGTGVVSHGILRREAFLGPTRRVHDGSESTRWVLDGVGMEFTHDDLERRLAELESHRDTRPDVDETIRRFRSLAARTYRVDFDPTSPLGERVLYPATSAERGGAEDARFVRLIDDGETRYCATYTAYDGTNIVQQLLETRDFCRFDSSPLHGPGARNKGLALFPRKLDGRYAALSRHDGATNAVTFTDDLRHWPAPTPIKRRPSLRTSILVGNCGSPIETASGWLALTHGVGPMRTYTISASLLDLDDPTQLIAELPRPLLSPQPDEQDGYVPNVVYSCGAILHGPHLVIPFGVGDSSIRFASVPVVTVLAEMTAT